MKPVCRQENTVSSTQAPWANSTHPPFSEAPEAGANARPLTAVEKLLPANLLDGDEVVILAIKPSLWFVVFTSVRWLAVTVAVILLAGFWGHRIPFVNSPMVVQAAAALAAARVGFALLQWVARLYVLTNRRVIRLMGILNINLFECPLTKIQNTYMTFAWYERLTGLGSISFATAGTGGIEASWMYINHPLEVHERVRSAIHRAQRPNNGI